MQEFGVAFAPASHHVGKTEQGLDVFEVLQVDRCDILLSEEPFHT